MSFDSMMLIPDWPAPARVRACSTTRLGGVSSAPYDSLNLGNHVGDSPLHVQDNRQRLLATAGLPVMPHWLQQVHGTQVINLDQVSSDSLTGDAAYTTRQDRVCAVMTADCLPVLFCSANGDEVAAAHAGWRGLQAGVLEETLRHFHARPADILAWMGPAIGPQQFEVGGRFVRLFCKLTPLPIALSFPAMVNSLPIFISWPVCVWRRLVSPRCLVASTVRSAIRVDFSPIDAMV